MKWGDLKRGDVLLTGPAASDLAMVVLDVGPSGYEFRDLELTLACLFSAVVSRHTCQTGGNLSVLYAVLRGQDMLQEETT